MSEQDPRRPDRIVISSEDLQDEPSLRPPAAPPTGPGATLPPTAPPSATTRYGAPASPAAPPPATGPAYANPLPPLPDAPPTMAVAGQTGGATAFAKLGANAVVTGLVAGSVGGGIGAILAEVLYSPDDRLSTTEAALRFDVGVWAGIAGLAIGFTLAAWDGLTSGSLEKAGRDGWRGGLAGAIAGFVGGYLAQLVYSDLLERAFESGSDPSNAVLVARIVGWAAFGGLAGLGIGIPRGQKKVVNGIIGGTVGGAVGGFLFEQLANSDSATGSQATIRFLGIAVTGAGIGLGVGLVDHLRRDAWIRFVGGPMTGKELILFTDVTSFGSDYRCDVVLAKDELVRPRHLTLERDTNGATTVRPEPGATLSINGTPSGPRRLRSGDTVVIGRSTLQYQERAGSA